tara:strand:- start:71 stop:898 length:828 start_codon:yes stop_codon:yes gene_type:complete
MMQYLSLVFLIFLLSGCVTNGYKDFYHPYYDVNTINEIEKLAPNEEPKVYSSNDFNKDIYTLRSRNYILLGYSSFNGGYQDIENAKKHAKNIGATVVLAKSKYTNTQTSTSTLILPDNKTTYHNGTVNSNSSHSNVYGQNVGSTSSTGIYSGSSTTYGTKAIPYTTNQRRYDQQAYYFVKSTKKLKFGLGNDDLPQDLRLKLQRNTGSIISIVFENSPAFYANLFPGDVIISIDGVNIINADHAVKIMNSVPSNQKKSEFVILREEKIKNVTISL